MGKRLLAEPEPAYSLKVLESTTARFADKIADANPKLTDAEVQKKALAQATKKLEWERVQKPALEKQYGALGKASFADSNPNKMQNTAEVVAERKRKANEFLDQPTERWTPPRKELQAFDRASIKDAMEGFPDVEQSSFPRDIPTRASTSHVDELYADPENRALIEKQIKRGLPLGGETFYASLYPVKQAVMEAGMSADKFDKWVHSIAPASARNSIMNEMAVGQFLRNMNARGIPLTEENVAKEMAAYKDKFGIGLPLMPLHRQGVQSVLEGGQNLREMNKANVPTNYKIPTYGSQKAGDFAKSVTLDVHEAAGQTQGSRYHPYFKEQGGFGNTEYNVGEQGMLSIADDLGIPGGMAQAGRWFGGGELTGLRSPRGDALDLLEKQVAFTLKQKGIQPNPANVRAEVLNQIKTGEGDLLPYYRKDGMPDVRETGLQRAEGGEVDIDAADARLAAAMSQRMAKGGSVDIEAADARLAQAMAQRMGMAQGGEAGFKKIAFMQAGGAAKGVAKGFKKLFADRDVMPEVAKSMPTARIGLEAPGIIIPSKMNNVREAVRNMKGNYGARRVERAADEIPNLERMYQEDALKQAFTGDNAAAMMTIDPARFEEFATPISSTFTRPNSVRHTSAGDMVTFPEYLEYLKSVDGFDAVPFLEINKQLQGTMAKPFVSGHEGRHRNRAMSQSGDKTGLIQLLPRSELREPFPRRTQEEYIEALKKELEMTGNVVLPQINKNQPHLPQRPAIDLPDIYAEGGPAFKTLQFKEPQHFDGGGIASPEESSGYSPESFFDSKRYSDIKKNAAEMFAEGKQSLASDYDRLKSSARARAQLAKIAAAQLAGGAPDLAHLGIDLIVDPLKSVTVDKLLTKPAYRSVLEGPPKAGEKQERVPMFGSLSDSLKTADGYPIGGSEHMIKRAQDAGLMSQGRFSPLTEIPAAILTGVGVSKLGKGIVKGVSKPNTTNSGKLSGLQPEAMTAPAGTPQGATYATKQEGPFYRVSPTSLDVSGAKSRGLRETDELQSQAPVGGTAGQAGSEVPLRISDEEVARLISDPASNQPLQIAQRFTKDTQGTDFARPDIPESSLAKQSAIGRAHQLAVEGSPEYKTSVFDAYAKQMPDVLEQAGAKDYDDLMEKAYRQLAKETDEQFKQLPYNFSYHRAGEGDYLGGSKEMMADVHGNKHLYVFQGGDPHDFLNRLDKASGLNENEKFRAVHDLLGHAVYGNQFGPKGEELAYAVHQQMYSPLARLAMASETRGQNSLVNYSPLNVKLKTGIAKLEDMEVEAMRRGNKDLVNEIRAAKRQEFANNFQFAPQKAVLLPPEFIDPKFTGGMPDYLSAANRPAKGTETQSVLTHFSNDPNLQLLDPKRYGTGIKGAEAERLRDFAGGVKDRSYVYLGEPGTIAPESGLGVNRYRAESQNLYDITKDPLSFRALARESNRTPFTAKVNAGITSPLQEANDYERLVKEYGYEGMINPNASKPMGIMFNPTPVQPRKRGGLTQLRAR